MNNKIIKPGSAGAPAPSFAPSKVLRSDTFNAAIEARQILDAAQAQARKIIKDAELAREEAMEVGRLDGYDRGLLEWNTAVEAVNAARAMRC